MTKKFSELSPAEQEAVELEYHLMNPEDFDELMAGAQWVNPKASVEGSDSECDEDWLENQSLNNESFQARVAESRRQYQEGKYKTLEELP